LHPFPPWRSMNAVESPNRLLSKSRATDCNAASVGRTGQKGTELFHDGRRKESAAAIATPVRPPCKGVYRPGRPVAVVEPASRSCGVATGRLPTGVLETVTPSPCFGAA